MREEKSSRGKKHKVPYPSGMLVMIILIINNKMSNLIGSMPHRGMIHEKVVKIQQ